MQRKCILSQLPKNSFGVNRIFGYIGGALCFVFLLTIVYPMYEDSQTISVDGTVVSILGESGTRSGSTTDSRARQSSYYWHEFRFTDLQGVERVSSFVGWLGRNFSHRIESIVPIGYYADDFS